MIHVPLERVRRILGPLAVLAALGLSGCIADDDYYDLVYEPGPHTLPVHPVQPHPYPHPQPHPYPPHYGPAYPGYGMPAPDYYSGDWTVQETGRIGSCRIQLRPTHGRDYGDASTFGCFGALFNTSRWNLGGNMITIYNMTREPVAMLWITAPNRMEGGGYVFTR